MLSIEILLFTDLVLDEVLEVLDEKVPDLKKTLDKSFMIWDELPLSLHRTCDSAISFQISSKVRKVNIGGKRIFRYFSIRCRVAPSWNSSNFWQGLVFSRDRAIMRTLFWALKQQFH